MFSNHEFRIRRVNTKKTDEESTPGTDRIFSPEAASLIAERAKEVVKYAALTAIGVYAAIRFVDTLSEIAVKKTKSADNE